MSGRYVLALDQGTTSSRSILFDVGGRIVATAQREIRPIYPQAGWVEHDPVEIWNTQRDTAMEAMDLAGVVPNDIAAVGIANQRETTLLWDRRTGEPLHNAIVWQCRRTAPLCEQLRADGLESLFRERTGLVLDAYFSGTKLRWLLEHIDGARERAARGELCFGTVDSWLLYRLTGHHATDLSNASRTLMFNIHDRVWDPELLDILGIPSEVLPEVCPTSHVYGNTATFGGDIPVASLVGDQQAALFGQAAFTPGDSKNTYGTGCFLLMNTGTTPVMSRHGLLTTIAWGLGDRVEYALEGSVFVGGAVIQWLRDELGLIPSAGESATIAATVPDTHGVYIVPAFVGLGAPHWAMKASGIITGLTRGANRAHIVRAALESIAYQSADLVRCMASDTGAAIRLLRVDGGAAANNLLMQHQADILDIPVSRGKILETTALGAAYLAGLAVDFWSGQEALRDIWREDRRFVPKWDEKQRETGVKAWGEAVRKALL